MGKSEARVAAGDIDDRTFRWPTICKRTSSLSSVLFGCSTLIIIINDTRYFHQDKRQSLNRPTSELPAFTHNNNNNRPR